MDPEPLQYTLMWPECAFDKVDWGDGLRNVVSNATVDERGCRRLRHRYRDAGSYEVVFLSASSTSYKIVHYERVEIPEDGAELLVRSGPLAHPNCTLTEDCPSGQHYANCPRFHLVIPLVLTAGRDSQDAESGPASTSTAWADRQDALEVLDDALQWAHMDAAGWAEVDALVAAMSTAIDDADWEAATGAVIELELKSPCRCRLPPSNATRTPPATAAAVQELVRKIVVI